MSSWSYVEIKWEPGMLEPARPNGQVLQHREVAAHSLGRALEAGEVVHHIDEDRTNNSPSNLLVFRTQGDHAAHHRGVVITQCEDGVWESDTANPNHCADCATSIGADNTRCRKCHSRYRIEMGRLNRPTGEELRLLYESNSLEAIGRMFGVTGNAVKKWCKRDGIIPVKEK